MDPQSFYSRFRSVSLEAKRQFIVDLLKRHPSLGLLASRLTDKDRHSPIRAGEARLLEELHAEFLRYREQIREQILRWALTDFPHVRDFLRDEIDAESERRVREAVNALHGLTRSSRKMLSLKEAAAILKANQAAVEKKDIIKVHRLANAGTLTDNGRKRKARKISADSVLQLLIGRWDGYG